MEGKSINYNFGPIAKGVAINIYILGLLFFILSFIILLRYRKIGFIRKAIFNTSLFAVVFTFSQYCLIKYPFLFGDFPEEHASSLLFLTLPFLMLAMNNPDIAFFFLAPLYFRSHFVKGVPEASLLHEFSSNLSPPHKSTHIRALLAAYLTLWTGIFPVLSVGKEQIAELPWFVAPFVFFYIFTFISSILLLFFHTKIPRCRRALLYSPIVSLLFLLGIYVTTISFNAYPLLKFLFLYLSLVLLVFGVEKLDLLFFLAFPYLFPQARIRSAKNSENIKWVDDFPSSLSIENNTAMISMLLSIIFASFFVVDYFMLHR
jgi:hypothetical protein